MSKEKEEKKVELVTCKSCKRKYREVICDGKSVKVPSVIKHRVGYHCKACGSFFE